MVTPSQTQTQRHFLNTYSNHIRATGVEHTEQQAQCNQKPWLHFIFKTLTPIFLILENLPHFRLLLKTGLLVSMQKCWLNIYLLSHNRHRERSNSAPRNAQRWIKFALKKKVQGVLFIILTVRWPKYLIPKQTCWDHQLIYHVCLGLNDTLRRFWFGHCRIFLCLVFTLRAFSTDLNLKKEGLSRNLHITAD